MSFRARMFVALQAFAFAALACMAGAAERDAQLETAERQDAIEACKAIESDAERLACYDRVSGRAGGAPEQSTASQGEERTRGEAGTRAPSLIAERWQLDPELKQGAFRIVAHKPVYILAAFHASSANVLPSSPGEGNTVTEPLDLRRTESKFQISFKSKLWQNVIGDYSDLWFGYTQSSRWQTFNSEASRPFRETDYEPELMMVFRTDYSLLGWHGRLASLGVNHQSNGRAEPLSRSWNRYIGSIGLDRDGWTLMFRYWERMNEAADDDDNPDIEDFMGRGDVMLTREWDGNEISLGYRHSFRSGERSHGAIDLNWSFPIRGNLSGYLQVFNGYGESLIDYNRSATYVGLGVSLVDWYARSPREAKQER